MPKGVYLRKSGIKYGTTGKKYTNEQKEKLSKAHIGLKYPARKKIHLTEERKRKISQSMKGKKPYQMTEETQKKMSVASMGNTNAVGHRVNEDVKKILKEAALRGLVKQQSSKELTSIEKIVYIYLKERNITFEVQYLVNGKFLVDFYLPKSKTVIEADGDYWHSLEVVKKRDKAKNAYLTKCGFNLIRIPEFEIRNGSFKNYLLDCVEGESLISQQERSVRKSVISQS